MIDESEAGIIVRGGAAARHRHAGGAGCVRATAAPARAPSRRPRPCLSRTDLFYPVLYDSQCPCSKCRLRYSILLIAFLIAVICMYMKLQRLPC